MGNTTSGKKGDQTENGKMISFVFEIEIQFLCVD